MDPVRFLSNPSSGAMGLEIAKALQKEGARVTVVLGPTHLTYPSKIKILSVVTALQMQSAVKKNLRSSDAFIATAAVGDWRFARIANNKMKKNSAKSMSVTLVRNPDILAMAARRKLLTVGFALETQNEKKNALEKLRSKKLDLIIANGTDSFSSSSIRPLWIERSGVSKKFPSMSKKTLSRKIAQWLEKSWTKKK
jgi:phosphopantothenoylcysteine decarboxylase/phosphopantothenate--cysteine ligase